MSATDMAALLGVSRPTLSKWVDQGAPCLVRGRQGVAAEFDAPAFLQWWREHIVEARHRQPDTLFEREQLVDIKIKEHRLAQLKLEWVERAAVVDVVNSIQKRMHEFLRQGAQRFAHRLVGLPDNAAAVEALSRQAEEQLAELRRPETWRAIADGAHEAAAVLGSGEAPTAQRQLV